MPRRRPLLDAPAVAAAEDRNRGISGEGGEGDGRIARVRLVWQHGHDLRVRTWAVKRGGSSDGDAAVAGLG